MPAAGLSTTTGNIRKRWADIDPVRDAALFGCSPATLAGVVKGELSRTGVRNQITASQLGKGVRQAYLERTAETFPTVGKYMSAYMGTIKHAALNQDHPEMIVEKRFHSRDGHYSGQIDHAAIIDWYVKSDIFWIELDVYDLKTGSTYGAKAFAKDPFGDKSDYAWQINLCADLIEEQGDDSWSFIDPEGPAYLAFLATTLSSSAIRFKVRDLFIEWIPRDVKMGEDHLAVMRIPVPRKPAHVTRAQFDQLRLGLEEAIQKGYAPPCTPEERWFGWAPAVRKEINKRCVFYCPYLEACKAMSAQHGETHPVN
jgi:hypothetical protein